MVLVFYCFLFFFVSKKIYSTNMFKFLYYFDTALKRSRSDEKQKVWTRCFFLFILLARQKTIYRTIVLFFTYPTVRISSEIYFITHVLAILTMIKHFQVEVIQNMDVACSQTYDPLTFFSNITFTRVNDISVFILRARINQLDNIVRYIILEGDI